MRLRVDRAGLLTTIQDGGRWGHQALGVPPAGPMDPWSHRLANLLAGNHGSAAALEITGAGPELWFEHASTVGIAGAEFDGVLDGRPWTTPARLETGAGSRLVFGGRRRGMRAYLAVCGSLDVEPVLGSRATDLRSGLGGLQGRALRDGDLLRVGRPLARPRPAAAVPLPAAVLPVPGGACLRVVPADDDRAGGALDVLLAEEFVISPHSDRMGYRLAGRRVPIDSASRVSSAVVTGLIQVPPSGEPILLMVERQTTGGYPVAAVVITADLPLAGQLAPGDRVRFEACDQAAALAALIAREQELLALGDA